MHALKDNLTQSGILCNNWTLDEADFGREHGQRRRYFAAKSFFASLPKRNGHIDINKGSAVDLYGPWLALTVHKLNTSSSNWEQEHSVSKSLIRYSMEDPGRPSLACLPTHNIQTLLTRKSWLPGLKEGYPLTNLPDDHRTSGICKIRAYLLHRSLQEETRRIPFKPNRESKAYCAN